MGGGFLLDRQGPKYEIITYCKRTFCRFAVIKCSGSRSPVEFYGYMRGGVGLSNEGGANSKWEVNKVGRLGNENDLYGEIGLKKRSLRRRRYVFRRRLDGEILGRTGRKLCRPTF